MCRNIVTLELNSKGLKPGQLQESLFRRMLLNSCKAKFDQNFLASKTKDQAKKEAEEKGVKFDEEEFIE